MIGHRDGYLQAVADANAESKPETLEHYFSRRETPSRNSPVGKTMVRILAKFPEMPFEDARVKAKELLTRAAGCRKYQLPAVLSAEEQEKRLERLRARFKPPVLAISSKAPTAESADSYLPLTRDAETLGMPVSAISSSGE